MKNLDDLLRAKAAQAETAEQIKVEQEEAEVKQNVEKDLAGLERSKQQLGLIKESLSMEETGRASAKKEKQQAETKIDAKAADLEKVGLSKEELLSNPDYQELEEVKGVVDAASAEEVYSTASVGSEELKARLESLGVEVVDGETDQGAIERAIEARVSELDTNILETRLKIPSERERVVSDIISTHKLKLEKLKVGRESSSAYREEGTFKELYSEMEMKLRSVPIVRDNPEVREAVMQELIKNELLSKNKTYQEKKENRESHETRLKEYEAAKEKLPEYLEFLNTSFFDTLGAALSKLDRGVESDLWDSSELKDLKDIYTINFRERKITGLKLDKNALPSVKEMERMMSSSQMPWDDGNLSFALKGIARLEGVTYDDYRNRRHDVFSGNLRAIARELPPKETVPEERRYTEETYEKWDEAFKKTEDRALSQAKEFTGYVALNEELKGVDIRSASVDKEEIDSMIETLRKAASRVAGEGTYKIEGGKIFDLKNQEHWKDMQTERNEAEVEKNRLEGERTALGSKPEGLFSGKKKELWEAEHDRLSREITQKRERIEFLEDWLGGKNNSGDRTEYLNIPSEIIEGIEGTTVSSQDISSLLYAKMEEMRPQQSELRQTVETSESKQRRLKEKESQLFMEDSSSDLYIVNP